MSIEPYNIAHRVFLCIHFIYPRLNRRPPIMSRMYATHTIKIKIRACVISGPILCSVSAAKPYLKIDSLSIVSRFLSRFGHTMFTIGYIPISQSHVILNSFGLSRVNASSLAIHEPMLGNGKRWISFTHKSVPSSIRTRL